MVAVAEHRLTDEQLADRIAAGEMEAFALLFDRHFQAAHDLVFRILRDEDTAVGALAESFTVVRGALQRGRGEHVKASIYAAAATAAVERARRTRTIPEGSSSLSDLDAGRLADPAPVLRDPELVRLVWESAAALGARDYALLDLQVRKGVPLNDLASELGFRRSTLDVRLGRLKDKLVASVVEARGEKAPTRVSPLAVFAALAPVAVRPGVQEAVWARVVERPLQAAPARWKPSRRALLLVAAALVIAAAAAGAVVAFAFGGGGPHDPTDVRSTSHEPGAQTSDATIEVSWTPEPESTGYSILWSAESALPDETVDLAGSQGAVSRVVTPGTWWFNLRTRDKHGDWTHTVHLGPYVIVAVPNTRIASGPPKVSNDARAVFRLEATAEGSFECSLDGRRFERCGARTTVGHVADGRHRLAARVRDRYGNADASPASWRWLVDTTAPNTRIDSAEFEKRRAVFRFSAGKGRLKFECKLDDRDLTRCKAHVRLHNLSQGEHELFVRATDAAGNTDSSPATVTWTVDTKRPKTTIVSGPSGSVHRPKATFVLDSNEDEVTYECSLDGRTFQSCGSTATYRGLAAGEHTFVARATDRAENVDRTPARRRWTVVDTHRPDTTITSHPRVQSNDSSPTFKFRSSEAGSHFECRLDGGSWRQCSSPRTYQNLASGQHVFRVRARDASGNVDSTPASWTWTIH
jgi:DNA-directed RNA polymerase specialized sigma24 family protein